jgi:threonine dehydrogenase-like Zn-dependent dehydrogenase
MEFYQAVLYGKRDLRIETELFERELAQDEILVRTEVSALSTGTDLGNYLGDSTYVPGAPQYPRWVGYSNVGVVAQTGTAVQSVRMGDRVFAAKPHRSAYIATERDMLIPVPEGLAPEEASLVYLTNLGLAALHQAHYQAGENIAVTGLGVIGLCTIALARAMGSKVVGVANSEARARAAREIGAEACLLSGSPDLLDRMKHCFRGAEADIVVSTSNAWGSYFESLELARFGGRIAILGFPGRGQPMPERNPLSPHPLYEKQLTLIGCGYSPAVECPPQDLRFNRRRNLEYILDLMAAKQMNVAPLITHRFSYQRMRDAYELACSHSKELIAAVFDWRA